MNNPKKNSIVGQSRSLRDEEAEEIRDMILEAQGSARQLRIPEEDLHTEATTRMNEDVARVINESGVHVLLEYFNRDFLYGLGRFDEYSQGIILKWGDGYSRKHIWITSEKGNLSFEVSHEKPCGKPWCAESRHTYQPEQWRNMDILNAELKEQFQRPVYERSED